MKKNITYRLFLICTIFASAALLYSCEEVDGPFAEKKTDTVAVSSNIRKILVEEFTGFKCVNCPRAAELLHKIKEEDAYGRIILISVHAGYFAKPEGAGKYVYDFRTGAGDEIAKQLQLVATPQAAINRFSFNGSYIINEGDFASKISTFYGQAPKMLIRIFPEYDAARREIYVDAEITYQSIGTPEHNIVLYITEDSVIQPQKDIRKTPPDIDNYVHENVLRGAINGIWGEQISKTDIPANFVVRREYRFIIPEDKDWKPEHLKIVAFVADNGATKEIYQAEEKKLINR